ncbi:hypothetical protein HAX54_030194, partial [Datura stramonium]|nr:hypothetical protein [Datura stramonium]
GIIIAHVVLVDYIGLISTNTPQVGNLSKASICDFDPLLAASRMAQGCEKFLNSEEVPSMGPWRKTPLEINDLVSYQRVGPLWR